MISLSNQQRRAIALGYFDGVHKGHHALMERTVQRARELGGTAAVFTFDAHPSTLVTGQPVPLLTSHLHRADEIKRLGGVDEVIFAHFDDEMRHMPWQDFIHRVLIERYHAGYIISGQNNRFGYKGQGTPQGMAEECAKVGVGYDCLDDVTEDGITVSSTYIRGLIAQGDMARAQQFLGHPYTVMGTVTHGRAVGRGMGIPTLNVALPPEMAAPPYGVYVAQVEVDGQRYMAATNIGVRPSFADTDRTMPVIEPHLLDFAGDLYGKDVRIALLEFLRPEQAFASKDDLRTAILQDVAHTRKFFEK